MALKFHGGLIKKNVLREVIMKNRKGNTILSGHIFDILLFLTLIIVSKSVTSFTHKEIL